MTEADAACEADVRSAAQGVAEPLPVVSLKLVGLF